MDEVSNDVIAVTLTALAVGLAFIAGCAIHYGRQITAPRIPMQWVPSGGPTWLAPRVVGLWFAFGFTAIVSAVLLTLAVHEPQKLASCIDAQVADVGLDD